MAKNSIFAKLLRSPWWVSMAIALTIALTGRYFLPEKYVFFALSFSLPFVIIGLITGWREWQLPGKSRVASTIDKVSAMSFREFQSVLEQAFKKDGYTVTRLQGAADFKLVKAGRVSVVSCKRWKAASHGLEPLRELQAAREKHEAHEAIYVAVGEMTENALGFGATQKIRLMTGLELSQLLPLQK